MPARSPEREEGSDKQRVLELTRGHVAPHRVDVWEAFGTQLVIGRREGYRLWDLDGRELIDLHLNGGTFNLGHRNPEIVEATGRRCPHPGHRKSPLRQRGSGAAWRPTGAADPG